MKFRRTNKNIASPPSIPYSSTVEAFPTPVSDDPSCVCQSPSWEAYDRRKQEKKDEKKAKDEAKAAKKPRRLSKAPPASSIHAFNQINSNQSEITITYNGRTTRPASMVMSDSPAKDSFYKQPRSRAGSFSSLLKSTFDFRRSSMDQSQERPFIGGIKLEYEQHLANERMLNQGSAIDDDDVHPALRTSWTGSSLSLKSSTSPTRATNSKNTNSRAYPPNTFRTAQSKSMNLASPGVPVMPDLSTIERWRVRVGLKTSSRSSSSTSLSQSPKTNESVSIMTHTNRKNPGTEEHNKKAGAPQERGKERNLEQQSRSVTTQHPVRRTPPPPEPPRRSSKRNSILGGSPSTLALNGDRLQVPLETASSSVYDLQPTEAHDDAKQPSASPSWENLQSSVMNTIDRTIKPMAEVEREQGEKAFWNSQEWAIHRSDVPQLTSSSSEDSASDCFNTVSMPSTPNTSRPQSERGLPRCSGESERYTLPRIQLHDKAYPSETCSVISANSFGRAYDTDRDVDPIQAAARKVMAALPPMPSAKPGMDKRTYEHEPLKLRSKSTDFSSISDSSLMDISRLPLKASKLQPPRRTNGDTIAKVFVECCGCKYYHDMPSKLYDAMVNPDVVLSQNDRREFSGAISMTVKCPWCKHAMSTSCCAGLAAMVYVKERLH